MSGKLFIISAPSGAGKTSLVKQLVVQLTNLVVSVSHTTRLMRPGEKQGQDYYFVSVDEFQQMLSDEMFLEYAQVFGNFYGTAKHTVGDNLSRSDVILEIDWQGAQQVKKIFPNSVSIFILPPSTRVLEERLRMRGQDDEQVIERRMRDAVTEISHYNEFDYLVVNDVFNQALKELESIIISYRLTQSQASLQTMLSSLLG
jgi:guanylate kinase